jgi:hypothetical protein
VDETEKRRNGETERKPIRHFRNFEVYQNALKAGLHVSELSKNFPPEEKYSLTDAEGEAAETQVHLEFAFHHRYVFPDEFLSVDDAYEKICAQILRMIDEPEKWLIRQGERKQ